MIKIEKVADPIAARVSLPASKSITNRVLIIRALCGEKFKIENQSNASDSLLLQDSLEDLKTFINVKDAGTSFRFLTAFLAIQEGEFTLTGTERMKQRPVGKLVEALNSIGAEIKFSEKENYPPLFIRGKKLKGGTLKIDGSESSQFISALCMIAPMLEEGLKIEITGRIYSRPYIKMTLSLMEYFGIKSSFEKKVIEIKKQKYIPRDIKIENDWSSASFWYLIATLSKKSKIVLTGLNPDSIQGDSVIAEIMKKFGVGTESKNGDIIITNEEINNLPSTFEYNFSDCPDLVIPITVLCSVLNIKCYFRGIKNLRLKESDRLSALRQELAMVGTQIILEKDKLWMSSFLNYKEANIFHSHNDHRMIMSLAALACVYDEIIIDEHLPVNKSYPGFWQQMENAGFKTSILQNVDLS